MKTQAIMVADSSCPRGHRLSTMSITFPRFILAELNTHRILSKNSASSRAIPFKKMLKAVKENPFIPTAYQKDHPGMQGTYYYNVNEQEILIKKWLKARDSAIERALDLAAGVFDVNEIFEFNEEGELIVLQDVIGVTKQLCNRLLETFMWHTVLISGTEWENFFSLRCPQYEIKVDGVPTIFRSRKDTNEYLEEQIPVEDYLEWVTANKGQAEIHMMELAESMWNAYNESVPEQLQEGEWHIPFKEKILINEIAYAFNDIEYDGNEKTLMKRYLPELVKISTVMAARTSYTIVGSDQKPLSYYRMFEIHDEMGNAKPFHASPFEHAAQIPSDKEYYLNIKGCINEDESKANQEIYGWFRNFHGFKQYRQILEDASKM